MDINKVFKEFCKETRRNGGVLVGSSIKEFLDYAQNKITPKDDVVVPIIVGKTNRKFSYNGMYPIEIGTDVYEFEGVYYFEMNPLNGDKPIRQKFYKEQLKSSIEFISTPLKLNFREVSKEEVESNRSSAYDYLL